MDWFPQDKYGRFYWDRPCRHVVEIGNVELEVIFLSLDSEEDIRKCRSIDFTGFWFNEVEFTKFIIFSEAESRTGRFPPKKELRSAWDGVIADMNAPDETHWVPKIMQEIPLEDEDDGSPEGEVARRGRPAGWSYFVQPPAVLEIRDALGHVVGYRTNPDAENLKWLKDGYYEEKCIGKPAAWVESRLMNRITYVVDGEPVFKQFNPETHIAPEILVPSAGCDVAVGLDFGRARPAAVCGQVIGGRIYIQYEFRRYNMSATGFAPEFKRFLERHYAGCRYRMYGDPKGQDRGQSDERTSYEIFAHHGMRVAAAPVKCNLWRTRVDAVDSVLADGPGGKPRFQLSQGNCPTLKAAMCGRYHIRKNEWGDHEPHKDKYSDVADALQYLLLGLGEGRTMIGLEPASELRPRSTRPSKFGAGWRLGNSKVV